MSPKKSSRIRSWILPPTAFLMLMVVGGCVDYIERRDTITLAAGDAQAWNKVVHTADPWPPYAMNTHISGDGQRTAQVIQRYGTGNRTSADNAAAGPEAGSSPSGSANTPSPSDE